jgi:hypothetical protein
MSNVYTVSPIFVVEIPIRASWLVVDAMNGVAHLLTIPLTFCHLRHTSTSSRQHKPSVPKEGRGQLGAPIIGLCRNAVLEMDVRVLSRWVTFERQHEKRVRYLTEQLKTNEPSHKSLRSSARTSTTRGSVPAVHSSSNGPAHAHGQEHQRDASDVSVEMRSSGLTRRVQTVSHTTAATVNAAAGARSKYSGRDGGSGPSQDSSRSGSSSSVRSSVHGMVDKRRRLDEFGTGW